MTTAPIVISNINDLQEIQSNLSGYYVLGADIDAAGFNFTPIGSASNPFTGIFDGQGHAISNLTINNVSNTDSGLFGDIGTTGTVENVGLINESVTSPYVHVGGLAGENFGTVSQSFVNGTVSGASYVGALVGLNGVSGSVTQSFATGSVNGQIAGGLVGTNSGAISDSYATDAVNPLRVSLEAGGLVGFNSGSITASYAIGFVGGGGGFALGGLVGAGATNTVTTSYWDTETTGRSSSAGGAGLTTSQLESGILPDGFDPTIWLDTAGQFPELLWQAPATISDPISPYIFANTVFDQTGDAAPLVPWFDFFSIGGTFLTAGDYSAASAGYPGPGSPQTLALIAPTNFDFGSPAFTSLSSLQAAYPFGTYTVTGIGNQSSTSSVSYQANYFTSTVPFITNYSSLNGFNPANDLTVHYNSFTPDPHLTTGFTFLTIWNANTHQVVFQDDFQSSSSTSDLIPANTLSPSTNYTFELDFSDRLIVGSSTQGFDMRTDGSFTTGPIFQVDQPPVIDVAHSKVTATIDERPNVTGSLAHDIANGAIAFTDADLNDRPTASVIHQTATWQDRQGHQFQLTDDQVFQFENALLFVPEASNTNNGKIDWGFTTVDSAFDFLGTGETITVTKTIEIDDRHCGKVDQDVAVTIIGSNDKPVAVPHSSTVLQGGTLSVDSKHGVLVNDVDSDAHDILHVTQVNGSALLVGHAVAGRYGTLTLNVDGSYKYVSNHAGQGGLDTFSYSIEDGHGGTASSSFSIFDETAAQVATTQHSQIDMAAKALQSLIGSDTLWVTLDDAKQLYDSIAAVYNLVKDDVSFAQFDAQLVALQAAGVDDHFIGSWRSALSDAQTNIIMADNAKAFPAFWGLLMDRTVDTILDQLVDLQLLSASDKPALESVGKTMINLLAAAAGGPGGLAGQIWDQSELIAKETVGLSVDLNGLVNDEIRNGLDDINYLLQPSTKITPKLDALMDQQVVSMTRIGDDLVNSATNLLDLAAGFKIDLVSFILSAELHHVEGKNSSASVDITNAQNFAVSLDEAYGLHSNPFAGPLEDHFENFAKLVADTYHVTDWHV